MMAKVTTLSSSSSGMAPSILITRNRSIAATLLPGRVGRGRTPCPVFITGSGDRAAAARSIRQRLRVQLEALLLILGHIDALADDVVLCPVEHEDRSTFRDVGEALVDDQCARILGQANRIH